MALPARADRRRPPLETVRLYLAEPRDVVRTHPEDEREQEHEADERGPALEADADPSPDTARRSEVAMRPPSIGGIGRTLRIARLADRSATR